MIDMLKRHEIQVLRRAGRSSLADDLSDRLPEDLLIFLVELPQPPDDERGFDGGDDRFHRRGFEEPRALPLLDAHTSPIAPADRDWLVTAMFSTSRSAAL